MMVATLDRSLENRTRQSVNGKQIRVGNTDHPLHNLYKEKGWSAVYEAMGLAKKPTLWQRIANRIVNWFTA
jgi:hypothetical protein